MMHEVKHSMKKRLSTKRPLVHTAFRLSKNERELWRAAAAKAEGRVQTSMTDSAEKVFLEKLSEHVSGINIFISPTLSRRHNDRGVSI